MFDISMRFIMKKIFFTADTHFSHQKIIDYQPFTRGHFLDFNQMDDFLIDSWNKKVKPHDIVYHLGDVVFAKNRDYSILNRLNGFIHLIVGNHDQSNLKRHDSFIKRFSSINDYYELRTENNLMIMSHYPIESWNKMRYNSIHLHGHTHGTSSNQTNRIDVGVDCSPDLSPFSLDEVINLIGQQILPA